MLKALVPLIAKVHEHAQKEAPGQDIEELLATMEGEPVFEFFPLRKKFVGMAEVRAYYEFYFADFGNRIVGFKHVSESLGSVGVIVEYDLEILHPNESAPTKHRIATMLSFGENGLIGERMYSDDKLFETMLGPQLARMEAID